jgi:hypothetical protein
MKYIDLVKRGYVVLDLTAQRAQGDWIHVSDITKKPFTASVSASWAVNAGERFLRLATTPIGTKQGMPSLAPGVSTGIGQVKTEIVSIMCYPNPFTTQIQAQFYLLKEGNVTATLFDKRGRKVYEQLIPAATVGLHELNITPEKISKGSYTLSIATPNGAVSREVIKTN